MTSTPEEQTTLDCPFLGVRHDPTTALSYPTTSNFCFHCKHPSIPLFTHQETYCLSTLHRECPVFKQPETNSFPPELRYVPKLRPVPPNQIYRVILVSVGILLAAVLIWQAGVFLTKRQSMQANVSPFPTLAINPLVLTIQPTDTGTPIPATETPSGPTSTPTLTPMAFPPQPHQLEIPITVNNHKFLIHRMQAGEVLDNISRKYLTTPEALKSINYHLPEKIWANSLLVISPNMTSPDPNLPAFLAYQVVDATIQIEDLASKLNIDQVQLKLYNSISDGESVSKGDWLLIPYTSN